MRSETLKTILQVAILALILISVIFEVHPLFMTFVYIAWGCWAFSFTSWVVRKVRALRGR